VEVALTPVASLEQPVAMAVRSGDAALYVAEKTGRVRAIRDGQVDPTPVLSLAGQVAGGFEQGLLGLAFSPDGSRLYVDLTDPAGDTHVVEYQMSGGRADPATARQLLFVEQPFSNHNGGQLVVTADGRLWIALGDGGSGGDPQDNAQSLNRLLGKILRIDPLPSGGQPYTVPPDNPFVGRPASRPEVWAYGLRNPWRFSFDRATGDLWIADVGQSAREEINFVAAGSGGGQNFGWARMEGTLPYAGTPPPDAVAPIFDYARSGGNCSVTGGYVYRGSRIPGLVGAYLFADFCLGRVRALRQSGGQVTAQRTFAAAAPNVTSFGQDQAGELYVLSLEGGVYRIDPA
jgi:glucose/arabinose dehydrogenase